MDADLVELVEGVFAEVHDLFVLHGSIGIFPLAMRGTTYKFRNDA